MKKLVSVLLALTVLLTFAITVSAASFVPSIEKKPVVQTVITKDDDGTEVYGSVTVGGETKKITKNELVVSGIGGERSVANLSAEDAAVLEEADKKLAAAYQELSAANVAEVMQSDKLAADETYVISDLFDLTPIGESAKAAEEAFADGGELKVSFNIGIAAGQKVMVATKCADVWVVLEDSQIVNNGDGTITVAFKELCPIAIIQTADDAAEGTVTSPQTSDRNTFGMAALVFVGAAAVCFVLTKKCRA